MHRPATAALFVAVACLNAPVFAQDIPAAAQPPVVDVSPPPPVVAAPPPPVVSAPPAPAVTPAPAPRATAPAAAPVRAARVAPRAATPAPVRHAAPARAAPTAEPAPAPAPAPVAAEPAPPPVAAVPPPTPVPEVTPIPVQTQSTTTQSRITMLWPWLLGAGIVIFGAIALLLRRRRRDEVYEEEYYEEPVVVAAPEPSFVRETPVEAAPVASPAEPVEAAAAEVVSVSDAQSADVDAMAAESRPAAGRPWLELLMRPIRAGTSKDDAIVQFELTVGNTGSVAAEHVQISTWMVAGGQGSDMEHMLIERPADATVSEVDIAAGDGTTVEAEVALSKAGMHESVLPVVVADARYRLPDGSEGRTSASFAVGLPAEAEGGALEPFPVDRASGLRENVEARLHGEPERV